MLVGRSHFGRRHDGGLMFSLFRSFRTASAGSAKLPKAGALRTRSLRFEGLEVREVFAGAVTFDTLQFQGNESAGQVSAGLTFTAFGSGSGFTVDIQLQQVSATAGTDFNSSTITISFPSYSSGQVISRTVNVPITNDRTVEDVESFDAVIGTISDAT